MLAVQVIKIYWTKADRSPQGAEERRRVLHPSRIEENVPLSGEGIFLCRHSYRQDGKLYDSTDYSQAHFRNIYRIEKGRMTPVKDYPHEYIMKMQELSRLYRGYFTDCRSVSAWKDPAYIPGIIIRGENGGYLIKWYSLANGYQPVRRGVNTDRSIKDSPCAGKDVLCEKAFELNEGESGVIDYNYRYTADTGQHYEQYRVYFVCTGELKTNTFTKAGYEKKYDRTVVLF